MLASYHRMYAFFLLRLLLTLATPFLLVGCWQQGQTYNNHDNSVSNLGLNSLKANSLHHRAKQKSTLNTVVNPFNYHAFWLWGKPINTKPLANAQDIYVLQGHVYAHSPKVIRQGTGVLRFHTNHHGNGHSSNHTSNKKIWLVYRTDALNWQNTTMQAVRQRIVFWENQGQHIAGIQIDFDAATHKLASYGNFLKKVRSQLPSKYQLSITGLLDWTNQIGASQADGGLEQHIRPFVDEIIIQTYQKTTTVVGYQRYLKRLHKLNMPFKIGLIEQGKWDAQTEKKLGFSSNPHFKGYVVFLLNGG